MSIGPTAFRGAGCVHGRRRQAGGERSAHRSLVGAQLDAVLGRCGSANVGRCAAKAEFVEITSAGVRESHVRDVQITKEAPNYRVE